MPFNTPKKPVTSADLYKANVDLNMKLQRDQRRAEALKEQKERKALKESAAIYEAATKRDTLQQKYAHFSENVKVRLLGSAVSDIAVSAMQECNKILGKDFFLTENANTLNAITYAFIHENGEASSIIYNMSHRPTTQYLGDLVSTIKKTHKSMLEGVNPMDPDSFHIGDIAMKDYEKHVGETFGHDELVDSIATRVADAIKNFIQQNADDKQKIIDAMTATKQKVDSMKDASDSVKESYTNLGRRYIADIREKKHGLFDEMVRQMCKSVITTENAVLKEEFMEDAHINIGKVVNKIATMYTFIETVNSMQLVKVDEAFINDVLKSIAE